MKKIDRPTESEEAERHREKIFWKAKGAFPVVLRSPATGFQTQFHVFFGLVSHLFGRL